MHTKMRLGRGAVVAATTILVAAGTVLIAAAQVPEGCDPGVGPITESNRFTAYDARRTHLDDSPVMSVGSAASSEARMDGLPIRWEAGDGVNSSYQYFLGGQMDQGLTVSGFRGAGGIQLDRDAVTDGDPYTADDVIAQVGDRAVKVQIGEYEGALVWADPDGLGARPHHLYWSDGAYNYALIAVRGPQRMVQLGREYVCG